MAANLTWTTEAHNGRNIHLATADDMLAIVHENIAAGVIRVSIGSADADGRACPIQFGDKFATVDEAKAAAAAAMAD